MNTSEFILRILVALVCGFIVGAERQWRQRRAGLRTCTLVAIGSALFVTLPAHFEHESSPTRIAAQIVTGVGFLGAGCIIHSGLSVRGLNTAGTLWCSAAIGVLAGTGLFLHAVTGALAVLVVNIAFRPLANLLGRFNPRSEDETENRYLIALTCMDKRQAGLRQMLVQTLLHVSHLRLQSLETAEHSTPAHVVLKAVLTSPQRADPDVEKLVSQLTLAPGVVGARWDMQKPEPHDGLGGRIEARGDAEP